jgi:hypothetical protein
MGAEVRGPAAKRYSDALLRAHTVLLGRRNLIQIYWFHNNSYANQITIGGALRKPQMLRPQVEALRGHIKTEE